MLTSLTIYLGEDYYGAGYFVAAFLSAAAALVAADITLTRLNYLTFIGNNPSITGARRTAKEWLRQFKMR